MMKSHLIILLSLVVICFSKSFDSSESERYKRNAVSATSQKVAGGKIQYYIEDQPPAPYKVLDPEKVTKFKKAMEFLTNNTCLVFESKPTDGGRMRVVQQESSNFCAYQNVGNTAAWNNLVRLSSNHTCSTSIPLLVRIIMHEIGFFSMNVRPDSDTYMSINGAAITNYSLQFDATHQINKLFPNTLISRLPPFEFGSILTYGPIEFTHDESKPVYILKNAYELFKYSMGSQRVTFGDIKMINNFYCSSTCATSTLKCSNSGYPNPADCTKCLCPDGFGGPLCADMPTGTKSDRTAGVKLNATDKWQKRFIEFGQPASVGIRDEPMNRVDWIQAPSGQKIEVYMSDHTAQCNPGCYTAGVEIKYQDVAVAGPSSIKQERKNGNYLETFMLS